MLPQTTCLTPWTCRRPNDAGLRSLVPRVLGQMTKAGPAWATRSNFAFDRTAGSHPLAAAGQRGR